MSYFFIDKKYKYWEKLDKSFSYRIKELNRAETEKELKEMLDKLNEYEKSINKLKKQKDGIVTPTVRNELYQLETTRNQLYAEGKKKEEGLIQYDRIGALLFVVTRLKDKYTKKEAIAISIQKDGKDNGKVVTSISDIAEDIYKLEQFGVYLQPPYADELAKIIIDNYYDMPIVEQEYIENDIPETMAIEFIKVCCQMGVKQYLDGKYYDIPVSEFKNMHNDSTFRKYNLTELKEALAIYGFSYTNTGRNDYTKSNVGKVIRLFADKLKPYISEKEDE